MKMLRPGYRHVRLRNMLNMPLEYSTLFVCTKMEEEEFICVDDDLIVAPTSPPYVSLPSEVILKLHCDFEYITFLIQKLYTSYLFSITWFLFQKLSIIQKKQIYILKIYGIYPDDIPINVNAQINTTVEEVINTVSLSHCIF